MPILLPIAAASDRLPAEVIGIYSFPKSGNTWLRAIIAAGLGIDTKRLQRHIPDMYHGKIVEHPIIRNRKRYFFYKSHHKDLVTEHLGQAVKNDKVIYIYRHPLDVFVSYLNFASSTVNPGLSERFQFQFEKVEDLTAEQLDTLFEQFIFFGTLQPESVAFGSYFEHVAGAFELRKRGFPIHIMRYEDLKRDFVTTAGEMFAFIGLGDVDIEATYVEADKRTAENGKFFWKRQVENYRNYLSEAQIEKFNRIYRDRLVELGYGPAA